MFLEDSYVTVITAACHPPTDPGLRGPAALTCILLLILLANWLFQDVGPL